MSPFQAPRIYRACYECALQYDYTVCGVWQGRDMIRCHVCNTLARSGNNLRAQPVDDRIRVLVLELRITRARKNVESAIRNPVTRLAFLEDALADLTGEGK